MQDQGAGGGPASSMGGHGSDHTVGSEEGRAERGVGSERGDGEGAANVEGEGQQQVGEGGADSSEKTGGKMAGKRNRRVRERAETVEDALPPLKNSERISLPTLHHPFLSHQFFCPCAGHGLEWTNCLCTSKRGQGQEHMALREVMWVSRRITRRNVFFFPHGEAWK